MEKTTIEYLLSRYLDRFFNYLESRSAEGNANRLETEDDLEQSRSMYEILLGEKLETGLPPMKAAWMVVRKRLAAALEKLREPTLEELKQLEELERRFINATSRFSVWKFLKKAVTALVPRGHGKGPAPMIKESDLPKVIAAVEGLESEHPEWKREAIYEEVGKKFGTSWRTIQDAYLEAKRREESQR